jgi:beta-glucosidase-like glycosyl hydrolase
LPLLIGQDREPGLMRVTDVEQFERQKSLSDCSDEAAIYNVGKTIGLQCKAMGVHINFAPVVDVNNNPHNPVINTRSFSDNPLIVSRCAELFIQGLHEAGIMACAKHFPGHGDTAVDSHDDLPIIPHDKQRLETLELYPFITLIPRGIDAIMIAHLLVPAFDNIAPSSLSTAIVTDLLQNKLNFAGLIFTDGLGMGALLNHYKPGEIGYRAFLAGCDILLCPLDVPQATILIKQAILDGTISIDRLNKSVLKILQAKERMQLQEYAHRFVDVRSAMNILEIKC